MDTYIHGVEEHGSEYVECEKRRWWWSCAGRDGSDFTAVKNRSENQECHCQLLNHGLLPRRFSALGSMERRRMGDNDG